MQAIALGTYNPRSLRFHAGIGILGGGGGRPSAAVPCCSGTSTERAVELYKYVASAPLYMYRGLICCATVRGF